MSRLLIRDATVVTLNAADEVFAPGDIVVDGDRLAYVGPPDAAQRAAPYERVIDGSRLIAIPGLVNAHTHTYAALFGGSFEQLPLDIWRLRMRAPIQRLSAEQLYLSTLFACAQMLRTGTTTCLDHYFASPALPFAGMEQEVRAMTELGIRAAVAYILADLPWEDTLPLEAHELAGREEAAAWVTAQETAQSLEAYEAFLATFSHRHSRITCLVGPSAVHRLSDALFCGCRALADQYGVGMHLHVGEAKAHALQCRRRFGTTLIGRLEALGVLRHDVSMAHCVWLTDAELDSVARAGATVVHNPASNLKLGSGVARVRAMLERGVRVALGTDGPCSNDTLNMFETMRLAALLHTSNQVDYREWPSARQVLRMATQAGAAACGLADQIGSLEPGKRADIVLLTRDSYHLAADNDLWVQLVYCENGASIDMVLVDGQIVFANGKLLTIDEEALFREVGAARTALDADFRREVARAAELEAPLREMYFRLMREPVDDLSPSAVFY
ncbi:MAG TPA: amidohydrolase [Chloroflexota bacterium]|nr:amidohydrolase [Chloroflexota bacterium]